MRTHLLALTAAVAFGAGLAVVPGAGAAAAPAWQRYPVPATTGKQLADWDVSFASTYIGRVTGTPQQLLARDALVKELKALGYVVQVETYTGALEAVTATKRGATRPDELVVLGGHFDTMPQALEGTYDNATGTTMVMALARSFARVKTQRTMVFSFYNGEEEGALASDEQAKAY